MLNRAKQRGSAYVRRRPVASSRVRGVDRSVRQRHVDAADANPATAFDLGVSALRAPLPTAVLVRGATPAQTFVGGVRGWLANRAAWLRPRAIPMAVAFAGMLGVLASVNYLSSMNPRTAQASPSADPSRGPTIWLDPAAAATIRVVAR
jgi:hypothetical protein